MHGVFITRHGKTERNAKNLTNGWDDDPLTLEGISEAEMAALSPSLPRTITRMYVSTLGRARHTAEIINKQLGARLTFHDELREINFGSLSGTPFSGDLKKMHITQKYDWRYCGGECFEDVKARVLVILRVIKCQCRDGEALIVSHGGIIRLLHMLQFREVLGEIKHVDFLKFDLDKILSERPLIS